MRVRSIDDVLTTKKTWEEKGLIARDEMQTTCCHALQDKAWVNDPDGSEWEVFVVLEDDLPEEVPCAADKNCRVPIFVGIDLK